MLSFLHELTVAIVYCMVYQMQTLTSSSVFTMRQLTLLWEFPNVAMYDILRTLHWLPVRKRILFKLLLFAYKSLNGLAPKYINDLLEPYIPVRTLRSSTLGLLRVPKGASRTCSAYGDRSFSIAAPTVWNKLPVTVRKAYIINQYLDVN